MSKNITAEQLKLIIYSLNRPHGGGLDLFIKEHSIEFAELLERLVLPELEKREEVEVVVQQHQRYLDEEYVEEEEVVNHDHDLWDGCD